MPESDHTDCIFTDAIWSPPPYPQPPWVATAHQCQSPPCLTSPGHWVQVPMPWTSISGRRPSSPTSPCCWGWPRCGMCPSWATPRVPSCPTARPCPSWHPTYSRQAHGPGHAPPRGNPTHTEYMSRCGAVRPLFHCCPHTCGTLSGGSHAAQGIAIAAVKHLGGICARAGAGGGRQHLRRLCAKLSLLLDVCR